MAYIQLSEVFELTSWSCRVRVVLLRRLVGSLFDTTRLCSIGTQQGEGL
jgi:hypothetical protein